MIPPFDVSSRLYICGSIYNSYTTVVVYIQVIQQVPDSGGTLFW